MRKILLFALAATAFLPSLSAQADNLTASNLAEFLARYEVSLNPVNQAFADLESEKLALRDESGEPLGRHHIEDCRQVVVSLRQMIRQLTANPEDLVSTITLFIQTEALADDLFDLSQIAYDNDREELGKRFSDLQIALDHREDLIQKHALQLAAAKQDRLKQLEGENRDLQQKLKDAAERQKRKKTPR